jgi:hypothetical protein
MRIISEMSHQFTLIYDTPFSKAIPEGHTVNNIRSDEPENEIINERKLTKADHNNKRKRNMHKRSPILASIFEESKQRVNLQSALLPDEKPVTGGGHLFMTIGKDRFIKSAGFVCASQTVYNGFQQNIVWD